LRCSHVGLSAAIVVVDVLEDLSAIVLIHVRF